jgi:glycosyltransferase involved in cell wall biosynthesis
VPAERLRLLEIYPNSDYFTGAAVQFSELTAGLAARGHDVVVLTGPGPIWPEKMRARGITHHALAMPPSVSLRSVVALARMLRRHRFHVVRAHKGIARTHVLLAGLLAPVPVLILNRGVSFRLDPFNRVGYTTRRVTAIVAVCEAIKRGLVAQGVPAEKVEVIYSGTDTDRFHPGVDGQAVRRELGLGPDHFLFTQVGVRSSKGNDDVIDAFATVAAQAPRARLLIVGSRNPAPLHERVRARGVGETVRVLGYREDIPEILRASQCCVDASWTGLGLTGTVREALAVGTAVVATDLEGNPELVRPGETGLLVPPRDPATLARAMLTFVEDPALLARTAEAGRRRVEREFSLRVKLDRTEALYRRLVARAPRAPAPSPCAGSLAS